MEDKKQTIDQVQKAETITYDEAFKKLGAFILKSRQEEQEQIKEKSESNQ